MIKLSFALRRLPGMSRAEFQRYWREQHGPLVRELAPLLGIRRYVQLHTATDALNETLRAGRGGPEPYDGVAELWFDSAEAIQAATATAEGRDAALALLEDERRFIDLARSPLWIGEEHEVIAS
jgi:uncharacterized protein (TIGR02118 family)